MIGALIALVCALAGAPESRADPKVAAALKQVSAERIQATIEKLVSFGTRHTRSAQDQESIAGGRGIGAARAWIRDELTRIAKECDGRLEVKLDEFTQEKVDRIDAPTVIVNVYATLKGKDPDASSRIVLVTGHYDSIGDPDPNGLCPGANDDASGTAVVLECARVLSKLEFPATIVFVAVAGEEQGLYGSAHFAKVAKDAGWNVEAALNNDIVGGDRNPEQDATCVRVFSEGLPVAASDAEIRRLCGVGAENDSSSRTLSRFVAETSRAYDTGLRVLQVFRPDRYGRGGDHQSFNAQGYAAVRFTEYREDFDHQHQRVRTIDGVEHGDLTKFVNPDYVASVARLNAATLAAIALAPAAPKRVRFTSKNAERELRLAWEASPGAEGYELVWRSTTAADWENVRVQGAETETALPVSRDETIFAVRAVDKAGHKSLPAVALPQPPAERR